jgi:hypothetical protein
MSIATMILGESGTGKSASLRNLNPETTLLIQAVRKPLPFRSTGWAPYNKTTGKGSVITTDNPAHIEGAMRKIDRPVIVLDDFQYILANEYMRRSDEKGFDKFTEIGRHAWDLLCAASGLPDERRVYILAHTDSDESGRTRMKTIGKLLNEKITPEGMVTIVLRTAVRDGTYTFSTQNSGADTTKSPMDMFAEQFIENDLAAVDAAICDYYGLPAIPLKKAA